MSETPFDATEISPVDAFAETIRDAYLESDDLGPHEAIGVLHCLIHEITSSIYEADDEEGETEG